MGIVMHMGIGANTQYSHDNNLITSPLPMVLKAIDWGQFNNMARYQHISKIVPPYPWRMGWVWNEGVLLAAWGNVFLWTSYTWCFGEYLHEKHWKLNCYGKTIFEKMKIKQNNFLYLTYCYWLCWQPTSRVCMAMSWECHSS